MVIFSALVLLSKKPFTVIGNEFKSSNVFCLNESAMTMISNNAVDNLDLKPL
jgi:hypothetical protein